MRTTGKMIISVALVAAGSMTAQVGPANAELAPHVRENPSPQACKVRPLHVAAGTTSSTVTAGDPSGRLLVGDLRDPSGLHAVIWRNRDFDVLDIPLADVELTSVSPNGTVAGWGQQTGSSRPFVVTPVGTYVALGALQAGHNALATGVRDDGTVTGFADSASRFGQPVVWAPDSYDHPTVLSVPGAASVEIVGMAANGTIAGSTYGTELAASYTWSTHLDRQRLDGTAGGTSVSVRAVASRFAAGIERDPDTGTTTILRWHLATGTIDAVPDPMLAIHAVNRSGVIGGQIFGGTAALLDGDDFVYLPPLDAGQAASVATVSSSGKAAGFSRTAAGVVTAVTWRCG
jgi:hypothetical protein